MKKFFTGFLKGIVISIITVIGFMWLFSVLFPRAYNVLEGKVLGIEADSVVTVVQNNDTLVVAEPKPIIKEIVKDSVRSIALEHKDGCYHLMTKVNGIPMKMTLDTGASTITLSILEYEFLKKQNLLGNNTVEEGECSIANGETVKCFFTKIDKLTIGDTTVENVDCTIMPQQNAPLLLGMNGLKKFGNISIDYKNNLLILK